MVMAIINSINLSTEAILYPAQQLYRRRYDGKLELIGVTNMRGCWLSTHNRNTAFSVDETCQIGFVCFSQHRSPLSCRPCTASPPAGCWSRPHRRRPRRIGTASTPTPLPHAVSTGLGSHEPRRFRRPAGCHSCSFLGLMGGHRDAFSVTSRSP